MGQRRAHGPNTETGLGKRVVCVLYCIIIIIIILALVF